MCLPVGAVSIVLCLSPFVGRQVGDAELTAGSLADSQWVQQSLLRPVAGEDFEENMSSKGPVPWS